VHTKKSGRLLAKKLKKGTNPAKMLENHVERGATFEHGTENEEICKKGTEWGGVTHHSKQTPASNEKKWKKITEGGGWSYA